jgi:hypothetical protein
MTNPAIYDASSSFRPGYKNFRNTLYEIDRESNRPKGAVGCGQIGNLEGGRIRRGYGLGEGGGNQTSGKGL